MIKTVISNMSVDQLILIFILSNKHLKFYLCIAIISKESQKRIILIMGVVQNYSCILFRSLNSVQKETQVPAQLL